MMKQIKRLLSLLVVAVICCGLTGCHDDDFKKVRIEIDINTENVPVRAYGPFIHGEGGIPLVIKNHFEWEDILEKGRIVYVDLRCDEPNVLMTAKIYINGKLKYKKDCNSYLDSPHFKI